MTNDIEALLWSLGCVWMIRAERFLARSPPLLNSSLLVMGLYCAANYLLPQLAVQVASQQELGQGDEIACGFLRLGITIAVLVVVSFATPGRPRRRIFGAVVFPFLGLFGLLAVTLGCEIVGSLGAPTSHSAAVAVLDGMIIGAIVAALLAVPAALLYRSSAAPLVTLMLVPAIAKAGWGGEWLADICSLSIVATMTRTWSRWLNCLPDPS